MKILKFVKKKIYSASSRPITNLMGSPVVLLTDVSSTTCESLSIYDLAQNNCLLLGFTCCSLLVILLGITYIVRKNKVDEKLNLEELKINELGDHQSNLVKEVDAFLELPNFCLDVHMYSLKLDVLNRVLNIKDFECKNLIIEKLIKNRLKYIDYGIDNMGITTGVVYDVLEKENWDFENVRKVNVDIYEEMLAVRWEEYEDKIYEKENYEEMLELVWEGYEGENYEKENYEEMVELLWEGYEGENYEEMLDLMVEAGDRSEYDNLENAEIVFPSANQLVPEGQEDNFYFSELSISNCIELSSDNSIQLLIDNSFNPDLYCIFILIGDILWRIILFLISIFV